MKLMLVSSWNASTLNVNESVECSNDIIRIHLPYYFINGYPNHYIISHQSLPAHYQL